MNKPFHLVYSLRHRSQVRLLIYQDRNWPDIMAEIQVVDETNRHWECMIQCFSF